MTGTDIAAPVLGGGRVLVAERDEDAAAALTAVLRLNGLDAHAARTGAAALAATARDRPQVLILDLDLPDLDGYEVIRRVRAFAFPPAVVVLTGHTTAARRRAAAQAGADAYLLKPADPVELVSLLLKLCSGTQARGA
jgi:DNA-binding response OmpR family regulator